MILAREISGKAEETVNAIKLTLSKPVIYAKISDENGEIGKYEDGKDNYFVWVDDTLPDEAFEINVVHQLLHLQQISRGFPFTKAISEHTDGDVNFAASFSNLFNDIIMDLEVEHRLKEEYNYDTTYFTSKRLGYFKNIRDGGYKKFANNSFLQRITGVRLGVYSYFAPTELSDEMCECFSTEYPNIIDIANRIKAIAAANNFNDPDGMSEALKKMLVYLKVSQYIKIGYKNDWYFYDAARDRWTIDSGR